jgi:hypothetical protein
MHGSYDHACVTASRYVESALDGLLDHLEPAALSVLGDVAEFVVSRRK